MTKQANAIEVHALCKQFQRRLREPGFAGFVRSYVASRYEHVDAVRGIDFEVAQGEALALIGPNGAGKSTTLKMLTGILYPSSGEARVLGLSPWRERQRLALSIATVFGQRSQLWYDLPVIDSFDLLARIYEIAPHEYRARRAQLVERFELAPLLSTAVRKLSLGQRMRCEVAGALLHRPRVLFLDEPTIGLDVLAKQEIRALLREAQREEGVTVLLTSHDAGDIERVCDRVLVINHGAIVVDEGVSALIGRYRRHKLLEVTLEQPIAQAPEFAGTELVEWSPLGFKLQVHTSARTLGALLSKLVDSFVVADIRTSDAPLEEIIGRLYRQAAVVHAAREAS